MPCVVPTCGRSEGSFMLFPRDGILSERWFEAIQIGCGILMELDEDRDLSQTEICLWHFGTDEASSLEDEEDDHRYREPKLFANGNGEKVEITSCRLCLQFFPRSYVLSADGNLAGSDLKSTIYEALTIAIGEGDFLQHVCIECLARLELLVSIQREFSQAEVEFQELLKSARECSFDVHSMVKLDALIDEERAESTPEPEYDIVEEIIDDGQTAEKATVRVTITERKKTGPAVVKVRKKRKQVNLNLVNIMKKKCYICSTVFKDANELSLHLTEMHSGKDGYHCEECSLDFPLLPAYNRHLSRHDKSERPHKCNFCPIRFKSTIQLKAHENRLHGTSHDVNYLPEQPSRIECETCGKVFSYKHKLKMHIRMVHMGSKQPSCNICHKTFTATSSLERHMLLHTNEKPHVCPKCGISFRRALLLRHHMQMEHEGRNPHVCAECQEQFKNYHQLYIHKQVVHLKKPYGGGTKQRKYHLDCKLCKSSHSKTSDLERHIKSDHPGETYPYPQCTDCPRTFLSKTHLDHHKAIHTDKYACQECGKRNTSIQTLQTHMENAHSDVRRYDCPVCINKSYKTAVSLRQHMATHSHGKKHVCEYCQKGFVRKDHMLIHRRIHTGEKPFQCTNCLKRFNDDASFCRHRKRCLEPMAKADEDNVDDLLNFDFQC
ncbi:hypothetical protein RP20_CCG026951 [Aedes albopictus]|nr:hypothetical protein RP20_CCG026951 [Aedes albopictus]